MNFNQETTIEPKQEIKQENKKKYQNQKNKDKLTLKPTKRWKRILQKGTNSIAFPLILGIGLILKSIFFYTQTIAQTEPIATYTIIGTAIILTTLTCFLAMLPNRARIITALGLDTILSFILWGDQVYYQYSNNVLSVSQITNLQYGEEIMGTLPLLLQINQLIYVIDILIVIGLMLGKVISISRKPRKTRRQKIGKITLGIIGSILFFLTCVHYGEKGIDKSYNKDLQIRESTIFGYHLLDIENRINVKKQAPFKKKEEMLAIYEPLKETYKLNDENQVIPEIEGIAQNKNTIIIQLESFQEFVLHQTINGQEITPNLNRFLTENIEFTDMHMQSYSSTADSEFSTITSFYPMENGMSFSHYDGNHYDDIFTMFHQAGYQTGYMHGNVGSFWNRNNVYKRLPIDYIDFIDQFEDTSEMVNGYLSDELLYTQAVQKLKTRQIEGKPFFEFIVAASSHTGFGLEGLQDRSKISIDVGKYQDTYFGHYIEAINYADYAFGVFLEKLKQENLYEDTVILVFGDHNGLPMVNEELEEFLQERHAEMNEIDLKLTYTRVASGMKIPGIEAMKINKPISKLDIKPTFALLCGLHDGISLGTSFFGTKDYVCLNNERIIADDSYFDEVWYNRSTGKIIDEENCSEEEKLKLTQRVQNMKAELAISLSTNIHNLLAE